MEQERLKRASEEPNEAKIIGEKSDGKFIWLEIHEISNIEPEFSQEEEIKNNELKLENATKKEENLLADIAQGKIDERENTQRKIENTVQEEQREKLEVPKINDNKREF